MNKREIVQTLLDHMQKGNFKDARAMLTDDFQFSGPIPKPINADDWLAMGTHMRTAFPDLNYNFRVVGEEGNNMVKITSQLMGTHRGSFDLTNMDMGVIPATNKAFSTEVIKAKLTIRDGKITSWAAEPTEGGGLMAILKQLGVDVPDMTHA